MTFLILTYYTKLILIYELLNTVLYSNHTKHLVDIMFIPILQSIWILTIYSLYKLSCYKVYDDYFKEKNFIDDYTTNFTFNIKLLIHRS